jgi:glycerol-3-phosphate dehydrogenase
MRLLRGVSGEAILTQTNVIMTRSGVAFICGGKWSSYRAMAEELIDYVIKHKQLDRGRVGPAGDGAGGDDTAALKPPLTPCVTRDVKLLGGSGCFATGPRRAGARSGRQLRLPW